MKPAGKHLATLGVILCCTATGAGRSFAAPAKAEIDEAIAAMSTYEYGQSRKPLQRVEALVRETHLDAELRLHLEQQMARLLLSSSSTMASKQFVCRKLWQIGTDASLGALERLLLDEKTTEMACYAVASRRSERVNHALLSALEKLEGKALIAVINLLGDRRDSRSADALSGITRNKDDDTATAAVVALGKIATNQAVDALKALGKDSNVALRRAASHALLESARELASRGKLSEAGPLYRLLSTADHPLQVRRGAIQGRMELGEAEAVSTVLSTVEGEDGTLKAAAYSSFSRAGGNLARAIRGLRSPKEKKRVLSGLAGIPHPGALELVLRQSEDPEERSAALATALDLARQQMGADPRLAREMLEDLLALSEDKGLRDLLQELSGAGSPGAADRLPVVLFDGESFAGWEGDTTNTWRIEDGAIMAGSLERAAPRNEFLATTKEFENFDLRLKFRITGNHRVNAGVQFRTRRIPNHHEVSGYQADIGPGVDGHLYDESRRRRMLATPGRETLEKAQAAAGYAGWQTYRIRAEGDRIQLWLNGVETIDYVERDAGIARTGIVALQIHGGMQAIIAYKDITIKELSAPSSSKP